MEALGAVRLLVKNGYHLDAIVAGDEADVVEHLKERAIYEHTLRIPWPYGPEHFRQWFAHQDPDRTFAIRGPDGRLVGATGFNELIPGHRAEIGYWLARPFWGRGIMTAVVATIVRHGLDDHRLVRIEAEVFATNPASARVLEKNGFVLEGTLRKQILKDGRFVDACLYALVR